MTGLNHNDHGSSLEGRASYDGASPLLGTDIRQILSADCVEDRRQRLSLLVMRP